jgi:cardiolipin synthase
MRHCIYLPSLLKRLANFYTRPFLIQCLAVLLTVVSFSACSTVEPVPQLPLSQGNPEPKVLPTVLTSKRTDSVGDTKSLLQHRWKNSFKDTALIARLEELATGQPLIAGNKVTLLYDGPQTMDAMMDALQHAQNHINLETYIFDQDPVGMRFAQALIAKQNSGVQVNVIYDSVGTLSTPTSFFDRMRDAGIRMIEFSPISPFNRFGSWQPNQRDHRKLLVVDGKVAFTGGVNISSSYSNSSLFRSKSRSRSSASARPDSGWRDTHVRIEGPAVGALQWEFLNHWADNSSLDISQSDFLPDLKPRGNQLVRVLASEPGGRQEVYKSYVLAIRSAKSTVHITCAYFIPDAQIQDALTDAAQRGVDVKLVLAGKQENSLAYYAGHDTFRSMLVQGVNIYQLQNSVLHAKTAVVDAMWSTVGSTNIDSRSFLHNHELNIVIYDPVIGLEMEVAFQEDLRLSKEMSLAQWELRSVWEKTKEWLSKQVAYWL